MYRWGAAFEVKMMDGIGGAVDGGSSTAHEEVLLLFLYLIWIGLTCLGGGPCRRDESYESMIIQSTMGR